MVRTDNDGLEIEVDVIEELGADAYVYGRPVAENIHLEGSEEGGERPFIARVDGRNVPRKGDHIFVFPKSEHLHAFNQESGARL